MARATRILNNIRSAPTNHRAKLRIASTLPVIFLLLAVALIACSSPTATVIPNEVSRWDSDLRDSIDKLSTEDRRLAVAYLDRTRSAAASSGQPVATGVTVGEAIEKQRAFDRDQAQQRLASRAERDQQDQQRKDSEQRAAEVFAVSLTSKQITPADLQAGTRTDQVTFSFEFRNAGAKEITEAVGTLTVADNFFGTELKVIPLDYRQPLAPGVTEPWQATVPMSPQATLDSRIRNTDLGQMKVTFTPNRIAFSDGTRLDFATAARS